MSQLIFGKIQSEFDMWKVLPQTRIPLFDFITNFAEKVSGILTFSTPPGGDPPGWGTPPLGKADRFKLKLNSIRSGLRSFVACLPDST